MPISDGLTSLTTGFRFPIEKRTSETEHPAERSEAGKKIADFRFSIGLLTGRLIINWKSGVQARDKTKEAIPNIQDCLFVPFDTSSRDICGSHLSTGITSVILRATFPPEAG